VRCTYPDLLTEQHTRALVRPKVPTTVEYWLLDFLPPEAIQPIVVFTGEAEFKTSIPAGVYTMAGCVAYVERNTTEVMSENRVQFCVGRLETVRLSITKATDIEHVQRLRRRYGNDE
jgi:hypothetical protein